MQATALPVIVIAIGIVAAYKASGDSLYGIGVAVMAQLSMTGLIVALDAYGPVTDNAGGIAEMADLDESVRGITDPLGGREHDEGGDEGLCDRLGGLAALITSSMSTRARLHGGGRRRRLRPQRPVGDRGPLHRRPDAVPVRVARHAGRRPCRRPGRGRGAAPSSARSRGSSEGTGQPDYSRAVDIVTNSAIKMLLPALIPIVIPIVVGIINEGARGS